MQFTINFSIQAAEFNNAFVFAGGGVRGAGAAINYKRFIDETNNVVKSNLFVGTSTGALIAGILAMGACADDVVELYLQEAKNIFVKNTEHSGTAYKNTGIKSIIKKYISKYFPGREDIMLNELKIKVVLVGFSNDGSHHPVLFSNIPGVGKFQNTSLVTALMASAAAPTFFPPVQCRNNDGDYQEVIDGGICSNMPVFEAFEAIQKMNGNKNPWMMFAFGTGKIGKKKTFPSNKGFWSTAFQLLITENNLGLFMDAAEDKAISAVGHLFNHLYDGHFYHIDYESENYRLDDYLVIRKIVNSVINSIPSNLKLNEAINKINQLYNNEENNN